jgi:hypothetical protein
MRRRRDGERCTSGDSVCDGGDADDDVDAGGFSTGRNRSGIRWIAAKVYNDGDSDNDDDDNEDDDDEDDVDDGGKTNENVVMRGDEGAWPIESATLQRKPTQTTASSTCRNECNAHARRPLNTTRVDATWPSSMSSSSSSSSLQSSASISMLSSPRLLKRLQYDNSTTNVGVVARLPFIDDDDEDDDEDDDGAACKMMGEIAEMRP